MKIALSPQHKIPKINQQNCASKNMQKDVQNSAVNGRDFSFENRAIFLSFGAIKKINKPEDYADNKRFAAYLENKIAIDLKEKDAEDIQNIIDSVAENTGADKKLVSEALGRIVQFTSYRQVAVLNEELKKQQIGRFYFSGNFDCNHLFDFLKTKDLINSKGEYFAHVIDDYNLPWIKECDEKHTDLANRMRHTLNNKKLKFVILDGFSVNVDNKPMSYNFFGADESLENITTAVVNEVQKTGKTLDEIFNGEKIETLKAVFGKDTPVKVIKNPKLKDYSAKSIANIFRPEYPSREQIYIIMKVASDYYSRFGNVEPSYSNKILSAYIDNLLRCYSSEKLNEEFVSMYSSIEKKVSDLGKTMEDVLYVIPDDQKSFKVVTSQFMKVNDIPQDQFVLNDGSKPFKKDKVYVILDDFFGTGYSVINQQFNYVELMENIYFEKDKDSYNFIFAPVLCTDQAKYNIENLINHYNRQDKDFLLINDASSVHDDLCRELTQKDINKLREMFMSLGYGETFACTVFPYSSPDNNTDFSQVFTQFFLPKIRGGKTPAERTGTIFSQVLENTYSYAQLVKEFGNENK